MNWKIQGSLLVLLLCFMGINSVFAQISEQKMAQATLTHYGELDNSTDSRIQLSAALERLEKAYDISFMYKSDLLVYKTVPAEILEYENLTLALQELLEPFNLTYTRLNNRTFAISFDFTKFASTEEQKVQEQIQGTVTDASTGEPLPGVNIAVKGTTTGTSTDQDGAYELNVPSLQDTLVFSFIGYQAQEIPIQGRTTVDVSLKPLTIAGDEVVVIGYGTVQKRDLTGSVSSVSEEDFNTGAQANVDQLIQGRVPGVHMTQTSGEPGARASIRIRGTNSITAGNEPLYVIDGMPGAPLNSLDPGDIESIEILKDASATAIYGSRGANGVILITTKQGQAGDIQVSYNGSVGSQRIANKLDYLNGEEYMNFINGIRQDQGRELPFSQDEINAIGEGTDWQDAILRTALVQDHQISFSGGSDEGTSYYISLNHYDQEGIIISSSMKRYGARMNISHSTDRFDFGLNLNTSVVHNDYVPLSNGINIGAGVMVSTLQMDPVLPIYNEDGEYAESQTQDLNNPVALAQTTYHDLQTNRTFGNAYVEYSILDNLSAKVNFGSNRSISRDDDYTSRITKLGQLSNGRAHIGQRENTDYLGEFTLNYEEDFTEDHSLSAVAGYTYQEFVNRRFDATSRDFPTDAFRTNNLRAGDTEQYNQSSGKSKNQLLSWLGRANYSYQDRYLATLTFRVDGSSRFGEDNQYGYFPSMALGWRLLEEPFFPEMNLFSELKLRGSYGLTGNQEIGNYNSLVLLGTAGDAIFDGSRHVSVAPFQLSNPDLKWETTEQFNIGLDFGLWEDRITGSIDYFVNNTYDLLLNLPIPRTTGFSTSLQNVGDTENRGLEVMVKSRNVVGDLNWSTTANMSTVENKVTNLGELPLILQGGLAFQSDFTILREGDPINSYWGYKVDGIFQSQNEVDNSAQPQASPGDLRFRDVNGDGSISDDDRTILGDPFPDFTIGLNNNFGYKGFNMDVFIESRLGYEMLNFTKLETESPLQSLRNRQSYVLNRWTSENPSTEHPSFANYDRSLAVNSRVVEDASFIRLKNVRLSYTFPPEFNLGGVSSLSVYASAQNLLTITDYSGYDPDVSSFGSSNIRLDYNPYPVAQIYTLGINVNF